MPGDKRRLAGKTAVIIGAASRGNIAQVTARLFAEEGATVMVAGRREEELRALASEIGGTYALCDISSHAQVTALVASAKEAFAKDAHAKGEKKGCIDIAVNATGWGLVKPMLELTDEELERMVALQFKGVHYFLAEFVRAMIDNEPQGGSLIQFSSATTAALINNHAAYIGTKAGSEALIRCVANDFGRYGIRANTISPAFTESPMTKDSFAVPGLVAAFTPRYPLGRLNTASDVAQAALWLASDEAFLTGQNIQPNGGLTLRGNPQAIDIEASIAAAMAGASGASG